MHAVLLCEMERGSLEWENQDRIDRIRRNMLVIPNLPAKRISPNLVRGSVKFIRMEHVNFLENTKVMPTYLCTLPIAW